MQSSNHHDTFRTIVAVLALALIVPSAPADVVTYYDEDEWIADVGDPTFIGFTEYPVFTIITDQYAHLGVTFPETDEFTIDGDAYRDRAGLASGFITDQIVMEFDGPRDSIGVYQPGILQIALYQRDTLVFESEAYIDGFQGLVTDTWFDRAIVYDPSSGTFIDDIYFGPVIPGPGGLVVALGGIVVLGGVARRRRA